jgi:hypothetical protein
MTKFLSASFILCLLLVLTGVNRGFDISDEGLYVLLTQPLQENKQGVLSYDLFFKAFYKLTGFSFSMVQLRLFRLITYLLGAWALAKSWKTLNGDSHIRSDIFLVLGLGIFGGYAFLPPSISYNSLILVLSCFWLALLVQKNSSVRELLLGTVLGMMVYVKFPVALILGLITLLHLLRKKQVKLHGFLGLVVPFLILESGFYFFLGQNFSLRIWEGFSLLSQRPDYRLLHLLKINAVGIFWILLVGIPFGIAGFVRSGQLSKVSFAFGAFLLLFACWMTHITEEWNHMALLCFGSFIAYFLGLRWKENSRPDLTLLLLIALPFLLHLGSNVYWLRLGVHFLVFWVFALLLMQPSYPGMKSMISGLLGFLIPIVVFVGIWWKPFELPKPLWESNTPFQLPNGEELLLDTELVEVLEDLSALPEISIRSELLAVYRNPGIVYLLGKTMPYSPGIWDLEQLEQVFNQKEIPEVLLYQGDFPLPDSWVFQDSTLAWQLRGAKLILLK